jgi:hypothetical protein
MVQLTLVAEAAVDQLMVDTQETLLSQFKKVEMVEKVLLFFVCQQQVIQTQQQVLQLLQQMEQIQLLNLQEQELTQYNG